jgi:Flp pilus assembly protein TadG
MGPIAHLRGLARDRRGAALVEFTLLAPLLISLMCGLSEFGLAFRQYHVMEKGVRDAGRFLARSAGAAPCPTADAAWATAITEAKALALSGTTAGGTPLLAGWSDPATLSVSVSCADNSAAAWHGPAQLPVVTITATAPYADLGMLGVLGLAPPTLTVSHQELKVS